ncbi:hypothetical protein G5B40_06140 [Pikeienuella piscinae]|uniref:PqqD family peptide modification chaperone n=1 Tax=Pikeienuella piscinae TaxID=2748098 RepID=A0A7L5BU35_9RHOB|nr:hypothetical protein [Pikeienuella piscinae]QIE55072.1 hypothetical protein G5B40_06140 [Pikeienuella piscinae]
MTPQSGYALLVAAHGVRLTRVKGKPVLFSAADQLVFLTNDFVAAIWAHVQAGVTQAEFSRLARDAGLDGKEILSGLLESGVVTFLGAEDGPATLTAHAHLKLGDVIVLIGFGGPRAEAVFRESFGHLTTSPSPSAAHLLALESAGGICGSECGGAADWVEWRRAGAALKELLTGIALERSDRTALHAATLSQDGDALLLFGPPGAGKSTLAAALGVSGFNLDGDDIALLQSDGGVLALQFPITVKSESWSLLSGRYPELARLETYERSDGQSVRYLTPQGAGAPEPRRARLIVRLERAEVGEARLDDIPVEQALAVALDGGWSSDERLSLESFDALIACVDAATCFRLRYSDIDDAVATIGAAWSEARRGSDPADPRTPWM